MGNCCANQTHKMDNYFSNQTTPTARTTHATVNKLPEKTQRNSSQEGVSSASMTVNEETIIYSPNLKHFTLSELKNATRNFEKDNMIGEGGFGEVYKGWIDEQSLGPARPVHGIPVAVKKLKPHALQGHKEWLNEVNHLGQLHHQNLVKLIGFCLDGENRLLVYEFMPRGSLENHLFKRHSQPLCWEVRMKVALDAARGLSFLHDFDHQIIYRDFKASNILLDSEYNAKLSDFGLAKEGPTGDRSHVSTQVLGTQGYAAPEYIATGKLTVKCDVYSFGVVLLELLTGRRALDKTKIGVEQSLVDWAKPYLGDRRKLYRIMDTSLQGQYPQREAFMVGLVASHCIAEPKLRPTMSEILSILQDLPRAKHGTSPDIHFLSSPWSPLSYSPKDSPLPKLRDSPSILDARGSPLPRLVKYPSIRRSIDSPMPQYMSYLKGSPLPSYYVNSST